MRLRTALLLAATLAATPSLGEGRSGRQSVELPREERTEVAPRVDSVALEAVVRERFPATLHVLRRDFPEDYDALMTRIDVLSRSGAAQPLLLSQVFASLSAIRNKYAHKLTFAPDLTLAAMLQSLGQFYDKVLAEGSTELCGKFAQDGSGVLFENDVSAIYAEDLDLQGAVYFEAVAGAFETPEVHGAADARDWSAVFGTMIGLGAPESYVQTIASNDAKDPDLCPALSAMFKTTAGLNTPEGARARAEFAKNLTGY
jgi:hypothetical protein